MGLEKFLQKLQREDISKLKSICFDYAKKFLNSSRQINLDGYQKSFIKKILNFAIIYDVNGDKLKIGDLLFNTKVDNKEQQMDIESKVVIQLRLALEQIASDKEIDVSQLDEKQKKMYAKVIGLTDEMDIERGVGHAK